jgi:hypothetical protein
MQEEIAKNKYYEMYIDRSKNRLYYTLKGFWESQSAVPNYYDDHREAIGRTTPGFSAVVDLRDLKTPPADVIELHMKTQKYSIQNGMKRSARIIDAALVKLASDRLVKGTYEEEAVRNFGSLADAEAWLDSFK